MAAAHECGKLLFLSVQNTKQTMSYERWEAQQIKAQRRAGIDKKTIKRAQLHEDIISVGRGFRKLMMCQDRKLVSPFETDL